MRLVEVVYLLGPWGMAPADRVRSTGGREEGGLRLYAHSTKKYHP